MSNRSCPLCEGSRAETIKNMGGVLIVECLDCRHIYVGNPSPETASSFNGAADISKYKGRHLQIINQIREGFSAKMHPLKVAEIGAGVGHLAKLMSDDEGVFDYVGFEPSAERAMFCRKHGLNVVNGFFQEKPGAYDAIVMDNVLEHVMAPNEMIRIASNSLKSGGVLIVIVPNRNDLRRFIPKWRKRHYWQPHCHISYFSFFDLEKLLACHDLSLKVFGRESLYKPSAMLYFKTNLDILGVRAAGLYTYGVKVG